MSSDIQSAIGSGIKQFTAAFRNGDADALANLYTSDGQLLPANSDAVRGTGAIRTFWEGAFELGFKDILLETLELEQHGNTAIEVGRYQIFSAEGASADAGKYIVIWRNDGGTWKLHRDIWTTSQPAAAAV